MASKEQLLKRGNLIQVFEHETLRLNPDEYNRCLSENELNKLLLYNDRHNNDYFTGVRSGIRFKSYVGVIQIGKLTIEILPKIDSVKSQTSEGKTDELSKWHSALLDMLKVCKKINVTSISQANLNKRCNSLLQLYFSIYLDEVNKLIHHGLIKRYRKNQGNVSALKGRLIFSKNVQQNLIHKERFYTEHQIYDQENLPNQILLKGLSIIRSISSDAALSDRINRIMLDFPEIKEISISAKHFDQIRYNRKTEPYRCALQIAKMLILNYSPDIKGGNENMLALLFDMNKLWEEYIYRMLLKANHDKYEIKAQNRKKFWVNKELKPDIVIKNITSEETFIIDTKWKIVNAQYPADDDLKQMFAYNLLWKAQKSILLYPKHIENDSEFGNYHYKDLEHNKCKIGFINVLDGNKLNEEIGQEILAKLEESNSTSLSFNFSCKIDLEKSIK